MYAHIGAARLYRSTAVYHMRISARAYLCPRFVAATEGQGYARQLSIHARHSSTPQLNGRARHKLRETHTRESRWPSVAPMSRLATDSSLLYLNPGQKQEKTALNATPVASIYLPFLLIRSHERYTGQHAAPVEETATSPHPPPVPRAVSFTSSSKASARNSRLVTYDLSEPFLQPAEQ